MCLHQNTFVGDLIFRNTDHQLALDFTGCFVGGSFEIHNSRAGNDDGDLILDNTFIDKRLSFNNYTPKSLSFINATFNGFEIPCNWRMQWKKLIDKNRLSGSTLKRILKNLWKFVSCPQMLFWGNKSSYIFKENIYLEQCKQQRYKDAGLPYSFMKDFYLKHPELKEIQERWKKLQEEIFFDPEKLEKLDQTHQREDKATDKTLITYYYDDYKRCIEEDFLPVYYKYYSDSKLSEMIKDAYHFAETGNNYKDAGTKADFDKLKDFFNLFAKILESFKDHTYTHLGVLDSNAKQIYKNSMRNRLEEQYHVLRHIWGSNGELKEEDTAYYTWMHHKNIADMHGVAIIDKLKAWIRYFLYEKVFGWGVRLPRIVLSTIIMVGVFTFIYYFIFLANPGLYIEWDHHKVFGSDIGFMKSFVFAIQTTFSAGLGDWAPIGSGPIKIPMTINAVLGVLMVTFLIGAYGRKMLR